MRSMRMLLCLLATAVVFSSIAAGPPPVFHARLSGEDEVPPVETDAGGRVHLRLTHGGEVAYKLIVSRATDVVAAHIHCAEAGVNGPVGVTLFSGPATTINGILARGPIAAPDSGNACGWVDVSDVVAAIRSGGAYVNVHTLDNPSGEIRGQIRRRGPR